MHSRDAKFSEKDIPDLSGYVVIVTGGEFSLYCVVWEATR